jgi:hypothetical protein
MPLCPSCSAEVPDFHRFCGRCGATVVYSSQAETAAVGGVPPPAVDEGRFPPGTVLVQRYRISGLLGKGGMGEVYRATDLLVGQTVALKFLPEALSGRPEMMERFRNELRIARQVAHPNVCRVYDLGEAEGHLFLSMEYVDGEDLESLLRRVGHPPEARALEMARRLCAGLAAAHAAGVLHRDFKPANVMVDGRGQVRIMDFGLAALAGRVDPADTRSGTPAYMAPEQLAGTGVSARSDIYALGLVLHELFTGRRAFEASTIADLKARQAEGVLEVPGVDPAIGRVITRCLDPDPRRRPPTALAAAASLPGGDPLQAALDAGETPSPAVVAAAGRRVGMAPRAAQACLAALVGAVLLSAWLSQRGTLFQLQPSELPPDALAQRARDVLSTCGYPGPSRGAAGNFAYEQGRPALYFWYRTDFRRAAPLAGDRTVPGEADPPPAPGSTAVRLDTAGRLLRLSAHPAGTEPEQSPLDWKVLFAAANLDAARFSPASPTTLPPGGFDSRAAWQETGAAHPVRVQAAAWRGRPVYFEVRRTPAAPPAESGEWLLDLFLLSTMLGSCALAWLNLRAGRGDRRGALRAGLFVLGAMVAAGILPLRLIEGADAYVQFRKWTGLSLYWGTVTAVAYLALEPSLRRAWPHRLIAWTRVVAGDWRDPLVGSHALIGLATGALAACLQGLYVCQAGPATPAAASVLAFLVSGPREIASLLLSLTLYGVPITLLIFFCLWVVCRLTGNVWAGGAVSTCVLAGLYAIPAGGSAVDWTCQLLVVGTVVATFLRVGLLAGGATCLVFSALRNAPLTLDPGAWYFGESLAVIGVLVALGGLAYRNAVGNPPLGGER